jgi:penicillin-insensitive murein endopeptidase
MKPVHMLYRCFGLAAAVLWAASAFGAEPAAKTLFGNMDSAANLKPEAVGFYTKGCLAGGVELPINGDKWQAMRLSRNRNWGHPTLIDYIEKLSISAAKAGWRGLLVGDMNQPRGGPMLTGHRSHQMGLDADIWLRPMPARRFTRKERESVSAISMLDAKNKKQVNAKVWTKAHYGMIKSAASYPEVQRILVNPAIKKELCDSAGLNKKWLRKIRPWHGHHYHMHVRLFCPKGSPKCRAQAATRNDHGCGKELDRWLNPPKPKKVVKKTPKKKVKKTKPKKKRGPMVLSQLPRYCADVLAKDNPKFGIYVRAVPVPRPRPSRS